MATTANEIIAEKRSLGLDDSEVELSLDETCSILCTTRSTLQSLRSAGPGAGPVFRRMGKRIMYPLDSVLDFRKRGRVTSVDEFKDRKSTEAAVQS